MNGIDRLELEVSNPPSRELHRELKHLGYYDREIGLHRANYCGLKANYKWIPGGIKFVVNPNHFDSHRNLIDWSESLLKLRLKAIKVTRLDLNNDIPSDFSSVKDTLEVKYKRNIEAFSHRSKSGETDGLYFGAAKSASRISVYWNEDSDKLTSSGSSMSGVTRIEHKLIKTALPTKKFCDLENALLSKTFEPFRHLRLVETSILPSSEVDENNRTKKVIFLELKEVLGFSQTKKRFSQGGHFQRKYKEIFNFQVLPISLDQRWKETVSGYFSK